MLARKNDIKDVKDVEVILGEECVSQHKLVVMDMRIKRSTKKKATGTRGRLKTWRLRSATEREEFKCEVEKKSCERTGQPPLAGIIRQDNKLMMMMILSCLTNYNLTVKN